ncbi:hypothetical protein JJJ17_00090 [Paracoccus caeni]|uniref:Type III effector HrpK n=1 Tax=Paracoccus caeni TaxID=657651 RepID=A0A934SAT2_9RHOB|nr:hypothetical protein [Paracoccus caeni]
MAAQMPEAGDAREEAEKLGIEWERPDGDNRSAKYILDNHPVLKDLGNQEKIRDKLKERVGDFETDADAAYRAVQVLEHIEKFDSNGDRIAGKGVGDGRINGITPNEQVIHGTEAGRLMDFGKYGFEHLNGNLKDADSAWMDPEAKDKAKSLGIRWERPSDDKRSAQDIIDKDPLLKNLGNQSGVKDMLKDRVGDFENDADAAYRASQVLNHIERFDSDGKEQNGKKVGDGVVDGFTKSGEAKNGTEAGRLQDFGKYGFDHLQGELPNQLDAADDEDAREQAEALGIAWERPEDDDRSAQDIIDGDPLLKNLGNQSDVKERLKERVGDFETDADAAYRASQVLRHVERFDAEGEAIVGKNVANGKVDGFTNSDEARHGTEAGRLQDFGKYGFEALSGDLNELPETSDKESAQSDAEELGIQWERPEGDDRSAKDILSDYPLLRNLGNQSGVKDMLKERVGDFDTDADAAYRAAQVLEHVQQFDSDGKQIKRDRSRGNDKIDGFTSSDEARPETEAARLQDFGKYGFTHLNGKLEDRSAIEAGDKVEIKDEEAEREKAEALGLKWERPEGDGRSAHDIIQGSPLLRDLGNQEDVRDMLKSRVGDFERDPDAAYRAEQVLNHIEMFDGEGNTRNDKHVGNDRVDGFTGSDQAKPDTEAGRLKDFGKYGFGNLKGNVPDYSEVGNDAESREKAEALGIEWERPEGDDRSARDIVNGTPVLRDLGNQSGVRDLLKSRVGDFETDADAAYRAKQVLERIEKYDSSGKPQAGDKVDNGKVDGFTNSGEAENGTEAGRLQDFGKYGFDSLEAEMASGDQFDKYLEKNPDADGASKKITEYASILHDNFDTVMKATGGGEFMTVEKLQQFKDEYPGLDGKFGEAIDFWSNPGSFSALETSLDKLRYDSDGLLAKKDISHWIEKEAPKDAESAIHMVVDAADRNSVAGVNTKQFDDEIFRDPDRFSPKEKAAVLQDLRTGRDLVAIGQQSGMWDLPQMEKKLSNQAGLKGTPDEIIAEIDQKIAILSKDPEVTEFMNENAANALTDFVDSNPALKKELESTYKNDIQNGAFLEDNWNGENASTRTESLGSFFQTGRMYQAALGLDDQKVLQDAVKNSKHNGELQDFYEKSLVSGDRFKELLQDNSPEEAISAFSMEVALYNSALDRDFTNGFDSELQDNFTNLAKDNIFKDATFDDLKAAFGVDGGEELDEEKLLTMVEELAETNPELLVDVNGKMAKPMDFVGAFKAQWDILNGGLGTLNDLELLNGGTTKNMLDKGVMHGVTGLMLAGVTIGKAIAADDPMTEKQKVEIAIGSVQTAATLAQGGTKGFKDYLTKAGFGDKAQSIPGNVGVLAGVALAAYGIFDGVKSIRNGDPLTGGMTIATNSIGLMGGLVSGVKSGMGLLGMTVPHFITALSGGLGLAGSVLGAASIFILAAIQQSEMSSRENDYTNLLKSRLSKYGISGETTAGA